MPKLRIGFLGCGGIANAHAKTLVQLPAAKLVAFCDIERDRAERFSRDYAGGEGAVYTKFREMYDSADLDAVYICLPPFAHTYEVELAAARGLHVFIEKPIALDMRTANRMVQAVAKAKVKSQVGFVFRFGDAVNRVKAVLDSGEAGPAGLIIGKYLCNMHGNAWWREVKTSGGQIVEQIIHLYDVIRFLMGDVAVVSTGAGNFFHRREKDYTIEDVSASLLSFKSGAFGLVAGSNGAIPTQWMVSYELIAQKRTAIFQNANTATIHHTDAGHAHQVSISTDKDLMKAENMDFIEAVLKDRPTHVPMLEGAKSLELVLAAVKSAETGEPVRLR
jgi:predicted dehydrogenase